MDNDAIHGDTNFIEPLIEHLLIMFQFVQLFLNIVVPSFDCCHELLDLSKQVVHRLLPPANNS